MNDRVRESQNVHKAGACNCVMQKNRLRKSLGTIAALINLGNEKLWPIFDRLEDELLRLEQNELRLSQYSNFQ